jgi:hypothetical protein
MPEPARTILELAETALPIFADPARTYDYFIEVRGVERRTGGVELELVSAEGRVGRTRFVFVAPETVRIQYLLDEEPPNATPMLAAPVQGLAEVSVAEDEASITVMSAALRLQIVRRPFQSRSLRAGRRRPMARPSSTSRSRSGPRRRSTAWASRSVPLTGAARAPSPGRAIRTAQTRRRSRT